MAKKNKLKRFIGAALNLLVGIASGILIVVYLNATVPEDLTRGRELLRLLGMLLGFYAASFIHILIHEAGHLVFGLFTGYQFTSFRIGSLMLLQEHGKLRLKRYSLAGTGGQCLMSPPDPVNGKIPFVLYNLGGCILNLLFCAAFLALYVLLDLSGVPASACVLMAISGFISFFSNALPIPTGMVNNDGCNTLSILRSQTAMDAFWLQLKMNALIAGGLRLSEMPDEWFIVPPDEAMNDGVAATIGVAACNRLMEQKRFPEAAELMRHLLALEINMVGIHRYLLLCDRLYCEMIGANRPEVISELYTDKLQKFMRSMKTSPTVTRTRYTHALLVEKNPSNAALCLKQFEKIEANYPYPSDIRTDREMIKLAQEINLARRCEGQYHG